MIGVCFQFSSNDLAFREMWHRSVYFQGEEGEQGNDMLIGFMFTFKNLILLTLGKFIEYILVHVVFKQLHSAIRVLYFLIFTHLVWKLTPILLFRSLAYLLFFKTVFTSWQAVTLAKWIVIGQEQCFDIF